MRAGAGVLASLSQARHRPPRRCALARAVHLSSAPPAPAKSPVYIVEVTKTRDRTTLHAGAIMLASTESGGPESRGEAASLTGRIPPSPGSTLSPSAPRSAVREPQAKVPRAQTAA